MSKTQDLQSRMGVHLLCGELPSTMKAEAVFGLVHGTSIMGANFVKDFFARVADVTGGRVTGYEKAARSAIDAALEELCRKASALGANAVIHIDVDTGALNGTMIMATAYGTAVIARDKPADASEHPPVKYLNPNPLG